ncbi:MAG: (deoxy)nucleoside triphosphate pyrophosphohydrolase [Polyangiaceae bacterium]|nr:(deoxy)nucleoside triphosphate pyrophosphohydrolase [Polyangiaceae bacterium]
MPAILVSAALLLRTSSNGSLEVLLSQRKAGTHLEGKWEFPGGKVEENEDPKDALVRELREELGIEARVLDIVDVTFWKYETKSVLLLFYEAEMLPTSPSPSAIDVAAVKWEAIANLREEEFPPADLGVLRKLAARVAT